MAVKILEDLFCQKLKNYSDESAITNELREQLTNLGKIVDEEVRMQCEEEIQCKSLTIVAMVTS